MKYARVVLTLFCVVLAGGAAYGGQDGRDDNEVEFRGVVQTVPASGAQPQIWVISGRRVEANSRTRVEPHGRAILAGSCVEVKGEFRGNGLILATRLQLLGDGVCRQAPDQRERPRLVGKIESLPQFGLVGDWRVGGQPVRVSQTTRIEMDRGLIQLGVCVEARGTIENNILLASYIETLDAGRCLPASIGQFEFTGLVETIPPGGREGTWVIARRSLLATANTQFNTRRGQLVVGACAEAAGTLRADGTLLASRIETKSTSGVCILQNGVVNAGSFSTFAVSPGQIVSIFGINIGPATQLPLEIGSDRRIVSRLGQTRVLFDGAPAPLLMVSSGQINAVVPCSVAGRTTTTVEVDTLGARSNTIVMPVVPAAPSLFTIPNSGAGQAVALNYDPATGGYSVNGAANPAAKGSVVVLYGTGFGHTTGACADGEVVSPLSPLPRPLLPVSLTIGGVAAPLQYVGGAPGLAAGVFQMNTIVPANITAGPSVPVVVTVGGRTSQTGVTIAVR